MERWNVLNKVCEAAIRAKYILNRDNGYNEEFFQYYFKFPRRDLFDKMYDDHLAEFCRQLNKENLEYCKRNATTSPWGTPALIVKNFVFVEITFLDSPLDQAVKDIFQNYANKYRQSYAVLNFTQHSCPSTTLFEPKN